jgi:hypothetical protein
VDHGAGFDDNWRVYVAAKQAWKAYLATLLEQIRSDEPLAGGKQRGHLKASIESYTQISACTDRKRICAQAVQAWKDKFAKDLADV